MSDSKERVLKVYPDADAYRNRFLAKWFVYRDSNPDVNIGEGVCMAEAWDDATSKLPPESSPADEMEDENVGRRRVSSEDADAYASVCSPAGETASEPKCPYCNEPMKAGDGSYWCMNKKCAEQLYPTGERYKPVPSPVATEGEAEEFWMYKEGFLYGPEKRPAVLPIERKGAK